jgi:predicted DsbA family dithiol-disulfide isomerase
VADFRIDIISDLVCPWCYLGYTRLKQAIDQLGDDYRFDLQWQPFELHPEIDSQGVDKETYLSKKFGSRERLNEANHALQQVGIAEGIQFNFTDKDILPNTQLAHRLVAIANPKGLGTPLSLALLNAYFTDGKDIGNVDVLTHIALSVGLEMDAIETAFSDTTARLIEKKKQRLASLDIQSVPTYVINDKYLIQGAHSPADFFKVLSDIAQNPT